MNVQRPTSKIERDWLKRVTIDIDSFEVQSSMFGVLHDRNHSRLATAPLPRIIDSHLHQCVA